MSDGNNDNYIISFSQLASQIISAVNLLLVLFMFIIIFKNKNYSMTTSLSIHLGIGVTFNAVSYFLSDNEKTLVCKIKSVIHFCSLILLIHILFIYYLITLMMSFKWAKLKTFSVQLTIYIINWIIIVFFAIFISFVENEKDDLQTCRPCLSDPRLITGSVYMMVVLSSTCVLYIIMKIKISKSINDLLDPEVFKKINSAMKLFIFVEIVLMFNVVSYLLKLMLEFKIINVIDRLWEIISMSITVILIGMGTSNIKDCFSKNKVESEKSITLQDFKDELYGNDTEDDNNN